MKRFLIIAAMAVFSLVSCSKETQIIGSWKCESMQVKAMGATLDINFEEQGINMVLTFKEGGVLETASTVPGEEISTETSTYSITEDDLIIDGISTPYELKGRKLVIYGGKGLMDMEGEFVMTLKKI